MNCGILKSWLCGISFPFSTYKINNKKHLIFLFLGYFINEYVFFVPKEDDHYRRKSFVDQVMH